MMLLARVFLGVLNCSNSFILTPACLHMCFTPSKEKRDFESVTGLAIGGKTVSVIAELIIGF